MGRPPPNGRTPEDIQASGAVKRSLRYLRVSSKRQMDTDADLDPEGNSIDTQRKVTTAKERALGAVNVGEYVEPGNSAQSIDKRPVFRQMLERILQQRDVDYVVIYMRSRAFRNYTDAAIVKRQLEKYGVKLISAKEDFGEGIWADAMEGITDIFNEVQVRLSGQDIKIKMANKARNGGTIGRAKVGYRNTRALIDGRQVNTVTPDPDRAPFVPMAFELYATGQETLVSLRDNLTRAGFQMPASTKRPAGPISIERLRELLRDRYYLGYITYEGVEYPGRHQPLIDEDLFDRVQRILDSHSGAGIRHRSHHHYLKGLLWCGRSKHRLIVHRAQGRHGGEYFYFFCRGRQDGSCDLPFVPVEVLEAAVVRHYGEAVTLPPEWLAQVRAGVDEAARATHDLTDTLRAQYAKQLKTLDRKESYYLDLAAEEDWPKDKLRVKIDTIRRERKDIEETLDRGNQQLDRSRQIFHDALALLEDPHAAYEHGDQAVRSILNKAFFTRLYVDGTKVIDAELKEPFADLTQAYRSYTTVPKDSTDARPPTEQGICPGQDGSGTEAVIGSLAQPPGVRGLSKPTRVELRGFEPLTPSMRTRCATGLRYSPEERPTE
jgi:site-specific DNA recombinase